MKSTEELILEMNKIIKEMMKRDDAFVFSVYGRCVEYEKKLEIMDIGTVRHLPQKSDFTKDSIIEESVGLIMKNILPFEVFKQKYKDIILEEADKILRKNE